MFQTKILKFRVSNKASHPLSDDMGMKSFQDAAKELITPEEATFRLNRELSALGCGSEVISITSNTVNVHSHNNGRGNTVDLYYTILYKTADDAEFPAIFD